ncbi:protein SHQ1 homolog [Ruditapes philippinarum]|uniref:protein SHQ1 homolog n=1 Tax=Ruditapes philippinarum TaxID=129788 RepID=UPI00295A9AD9|nr:protein SHQ1 homolog [Ruditapes philippinarum]
MLTPAFELRQDKDFLTVIIKAPFAKVAETEIFIEEDDFKFYSKPYFLRLALPGKIVEDGREKADYNADNGEFVIVVPKQTPGEHFEGLDMLTKLLEAKGKKPAPSSLIEVIDDGTLEGTDEADNDDDDELDEDFDWRIEQVPYKEQPKLTGAPKYGFANQKSGVFSRLQEDMVYIVDCSDPDTMCVADRREERIQAENDKFDEDHYIADMYEDVLIKPLLDFQPHWCEEVDLVQGGTPVEMAVELTEDEKEVMRKLPRKEYILDVTEETGVYLGLVDILYAYCYNHRTTEGENNCESGWTICKISSTLSWLEVFSSLEDVVRSCFRRSICYPLYRQWKLNQSVLKDVVTILQLGRRSVLKVLLEIRGILMDQDCRYVLNDLYITDYCVWIQSASEKKLQSLWEALSKVFILIQFWKRLHFLLYGAALSDFRIPKIKEICQYFLLKLKISKDDIGFNLPELEKLAQHAMLGEESSDLENLTDRLSSIDVNKKNKSESDSESDESDTESDSDDIDSDDLSSSDDAGDDHHTEGDIRKVTGVSGNGKSDIDCENKNIRETICAESQEFVGDAVDTGNSKVTDTHCRKGKPLIEEISDSTEDKESEQVKSLNSVGKSESTMIVEASAEQEK